MELEIGVFPRFEDVKRNAFWAKAAMDTTLRVDKRSLETYKAHLQDCEKNPTIGLLANKQYITNFSMNYGETARRNQRYMERQPEIDMLQKSIKSKVNELYPKTKNIRQYIIDNGRVILDNMRPTRGYNFFNRLKIFLKNSC